MGFDKPIIQTSNPFKKEGSITHITRTIYYAEVISVDDVTDGGRIKVRIGDFDNQTLNADLPWCYPLMPRFFHIFPSVGEMVRIFIEDIKYPLRGRFWLGSIISQQQKIGFDSTYTALSTTNMALTNPQPSVDTYPNAIGVYPLQEDIALVGRVNTDVILRINEVHIRAGKHNDGDVLSLNVKNPAEISMVFEPLQNSTNFYSSSVIMSDKIALISHTGTPQYKAANLTSTDRANIFANSHPIARGDVLVEALNIIRDALLNHIHPYSKISADKDKSIINLENADFKAMLQTNIVIN